MKSMQLDFATMQEIEEERVEREKKSSLYSKRLATQGQRRALHRWGLQRIPSSLSFEDAFNSLSLLIAAGQDEKEGLIGSVERLQQRLQRLFSLKSCGLYSDDACVSIFSLPEILPDEEAGPNVLEVDEKGVYRGASMSELDDGRIFLQTLCYEWGYDE